MNALRENSAWVRQWIRALVGGGRSNPATTELHTDDQSFPGGFGLSGAWRLVPTTEVPADVVAELGWVLDEAE